MSSGKFQGTWQSDSPGKGWLIAIGVIIVLALMGGGAGARSASRIISEIATVLIISVVVTAVAGATVLAVRFRSRHQRRADVQSVLDANRARGIAADHAAALRRAEVRAALAPPQEVHHYHHFLDPAADAEAVPSPRARRLVQGSVEGQGR
jgi:hypothetical protein